MKFWNIIWSFLFRSKKNILLPEYISSSIDAVDRAFMNTIITIEDEVKQKERTPLREELFISAFEYMGTQLRRPILNGCRMVLSQSDVKNVGKDWDTFVLQFASRCKEKDIKTIVYNGSVQIDMSEIEKYHKKVQQKYKTPQLETITTGPFR